MKNALRALPFALTLLVAPSAFAETHSTAVVQIHPSKIAVGQPGQGVLLNENYMEKEMEAIIAPATLLAAAKSLKIDLESDQEALSRLKKSITISPRRGTDFLEITVSDEDPQKAAAMANAIAKAYSNRRNEGEKKRALDALKALEDELNLQSEVVQKNRQALSELIKKHGIPYFDGKEADGQGNPGKIPPTHETLKSIESAPLREKLILAAAVEIPDNPVTPLYQDYVRALVALDHLGTRFGPKHPKLIQAKAKVNQTRKMAHAALPQLLNLIKSASKEDVVALALKLHYYNQTKGDYEQSRAMFREMKIKLQEARVLLKMPKTPVTIHERAK